MLEKPVIVIAYDDDTRKSLEKALSSFNVSSISCATFCEAENLMLTNLFQGLVVDLTSIVKAKGEEKIVACSITGFLPTIRVRTMGAMIIPMGMPGEAKQDKSLSDFITKTCSSFSPRLLRSHKRRNIAIPVLIGAEGKRAYSADISWGGMFLLDMYPEVYEPGQELSILLTEFSMEVLVKIIWVKSWGSKKLPGIGVQFLSITEELENALKQVLKTIKDNDRDRLVAA